jgi:hypothetical protein
MKKIKSIENLQSMIKKGAFETREYTDISRYKEKQPDGSQKPTRRIKTVELIKGLYVLGKDTSIRSVVQFDNPTEDNKHFYGNLSKKLERDVKLNEFIEMISIHLWNFKEEMDGQIFNKVKTSCIAETEQSLKNLLRSLKLDNETNYFRQRAIDSAVKEAIIILKKDINGSKCFKKEAVLDYFFPSGDELIENENILFEKIISLYEKFFHSKDDLLPKLSRRQITSNLSIILSEIEFWPRAKTVQKYFNRLSKRKNGIDDKKKYFMKFK